MVGRRLALALLPGPGGAPDDHRDAGRRRGRRRGRETAARRRDPAARRACEPLGHDDGMARPVDRRRGPAVRPRRRAEHLRSCVSRAAAVFGRVRGEFPGRADRAQPPHHRACAGDARPAEGPGPTGRGAAVRRLRHDVRRALDRPDAGPVRAPARHLLPRRSQDRERRPGRPRALHDAPLVALAVELRREPRDGARQRGAHLVPDARREQPRRPRLHAEPRTAPLRRGRERGQGARTDRRRRSLLHRAPGSPADRGRRRRRLARPPRVLSVAGDPHEILSAVDAMVPRLHARANAAEASRRLPDETIREADVAGYLGMLTPRRWGGAGCDMGTFLEATRRLAHGCASSAWTLSFLSLHAWLLCRFDPRLQEEVFASGPAPRTPAPLAPTGKATRVDGGFQVSGRWEWATGVMHADWVMVTAMDAGSGPRFCLLPRAEVEVEDVWHVAGMAATGSNSVVVRDVFVPEHRTLEIWRIKAGQTPGEVLHPDTNVGWPMAATLVLVAATPALGAAEGALGAFTSRMKEKMQSYGHQKQMEVPATHFRLGEGLATVQAARLVWADAIRTLERIGPQGAAAEIDDLAAIRLAAANVVRLATEAANGLAAAAGASSGFLSSPLQRHLRDLQMMRGHVVFDWDRAAQIGGKVALGIEPVPADLL